MGIVKTHEGPFVASSSIAAIRNLSFMVRANFKPRYEFTQYHQITPYALFCCHESVEEQVIFRLPGGCIDPSIYDATADCPGWPKYLIFFSRFGLQSAHQNSRLPSALPSIRNLTLM
jgi:hypothetical protein